jgi:hypothetical protein
MTKSTIFQRNIVFLLTVLALGNSTFAMDTPRYGSQNPYENQYGGQYAYSDPSSLPEGTETYWQGYKFKVFNGQWYYQDKHTGDYYPYQPSSQYSNQSTNQSTQNTQNTNQDSVSNSNSNRYVITSNPYISIEFEQQGGYNRGLSREEQKGFTAISKVFQEKGPLDKDQLYDTLVKEHQYDPRMIYNMAKALRHVKKVTGGNANERYIQDRKPIYDLGLLEVSMKLFKYLEHYNNTVMNLTNTGLDFLQQYETSKRHYDETVENIQRRK